MQKTSYYHCNVCFTFGGSVARYEAKYKFVGGHEWSETFPCSESAHEFIDALKPFLEWHNVTLITPEP